MKQKEKIFALLGAALCAGTLCGCATIVSGRTQTLRIDSNPPAELFVSGERIGFTPQTIVVPREELPPIVLKRLGFADTLVGVKTGVNPCLLYDIALLPLFLIGAPVWGAAIDVGSGAAKRYKETDLKIPLLSPLESHALLYDGNVFLWNVSEDFTEEPSEK